MRILLLSSQPERITRLQMFKGSLKELGHDVVVPKFDSRNWMKMAELEEQYIKKKSHKLSMFLMYLTLHTTGCQNSKTNILGN